MSCDYGEDSIAVYATVYGVDEVLTSSAIVTETECSLCRDLMQHVYVDDKVGNKGCERLSMNMDRFDYMCEFIDVAAMYPNTSNSSHPFRLSTSL
jgi:hypothetical protein